MRASGRREATMRAEVWVWVVGCRGWWLTGWVAGLGSSERATCSMRCMGQRNAEPQRAGRAGRRVHTRRVSGAGFESSANLARSQPPTRPEPSIGSSDDRAGVTGAHREEVAGTGPISAEVDKARALAGVERAWGGESRVGSGLGVELVASIAINH